MQFKLEILQPCYGAYKTVLLLFKKKLHSNLECYSKHFWSEYISSVHI
uniref:Uncharacterized protein n=1 Tax=Anguilla anguilla TaxID=7936 RepID=A0A0E9WYG3_ANGAN